MDQVTERGSKIEFKKILLFFSQSFDGILYRFTPYFGVVCELSGIGGWAPDYLGKFNKICES